MSYEFRKAVIDDAELLANLESRYFSYPHSVEQFMFELTDDHHYIIVAIDNDDIVGYVGLMYVIDESYITNIVVDNSYRRNGIADRLIDLVLEKVKSLECSFNSLEVRKTNNPAIGLYSKHNYKIKGIIPNYYSNPVEDALIMTVEV